MAGILKTLYGTKPSTWTFNAWVRRAATEFSSDGLNNCYILGNSNHFSPSSGKGIAFMNSNQGNSVNDEIGYYDSTHANQWDQVDSVNNNVQRDFDGWYNIHVQCSSNVANVYVNGVLTNSNLNWSMSPTFTLNIGNLGWVIDFDTYALNGQMQEAHFVDGQALAYSVFTENSTLYNNSLVPKPPAGIVAAVDSTGGYGTNGFYWDFATKQTMGLEFTDLAGKQWQPYPDSVSAAFNTGFVRTGSSARTVNNSSIYFPGNKWATATDSGLITFEGDIFNPGTNDLTIEGWIYPLQNNSGYIFDTRYSTFTSNPSMYFSATSNQIDVFVNATTIFSSVVPGGAVDGNWHHFAMTYDDSSSTWTLYWDGTSVGSAVSDWAQQSSKLILGTRYSLNSAYRNEMFLEGFRYTGQLLYSSNFTPGPIDSTTQYTTDGGSTYSSITGTVHSCLNSNCKDAAYNKGSEPKYQLRPFVGGTRQTTGGAGTTFPIYHSGMCGEGKWGKSSYHTRGCATITNYGSDWNLGGDIDFTFETWFKWNKTAAEGEGVISIERGDGTYYSYESLLLLSNADGSVQLYATANDNGGTWNIFSIGLFTPTVGQWHHFAYCRSASDNTIRAYIDGTQIQSANGQLGVFTNPALMLNGRWNTNGTYTCSGVVSFEGTRLIRGQNIYPSGTTFTPGPTSSTTQYTTNGGTSYSSITGTVPFCLDDQRSTITEDKSSNGKNGGIFYKKVVETGYNQQNVYPQPTVAYGDSTKNKFLKLNPTMGALHDSSPPSAVTEAGLSLSTGNYVTNWAPVFGNFGVTTGKYYFEFKTWNALGDNNISQVAITLMNRFRDETYPGSQQGTYGIQVDSYDSGTAGVKGFWNENALGADIAHTDQRNGGDIFGIAWDVDNHRLYFHQNGNWLGGANPESNTGWNIGLGSIDSNNPSSNQYAGNDTWGYWHTPQTESGLLGNPNLGWTVVAAAATSGDNTNRSGLLLNFGQGTTGDNYSDANDRGKFRYKPPTGFVSLCTLNKEDNEALSTAAKNPDAYMGVIEYTANGSNQAITGLGFQPDLIMGLQQNDSVGYHTGVMDSVRGNGRLWTPQSSSHSHADLQFSDQIVSFDSDGFTVGDNASNGNYLALSGRTYTAYCWKAGGPIGTGADKYKRNGSTFVPEASSMTVNGISCNTDSGFSIVNYQGDQGVFSYSAAGAVTSFTNSADDLSLGTDDWTVEFWFYTNNTTQTAELVNKGKPFQIFQNTTDLQFFASSDGINYDIASGTSFLSNGLGNTRPLGTNRWHHVTVVRNKSAGTYTGWLNGRRSFVINYASDIHESTAVWKFAAYNNSTDNAGINYQFSGYLCDLNVWRGSAQYSDEIIDIVKPSWTNGGTTSSISDFQKSTTNLLMAVSFRNQNILGAVSGISGLNGNFSQTSASVSFSTTARPVGFVPHGLSGRPAIALAKATTNDGGPSGATPIYIVQGLSDYICVLGETHFCVNGYHDNFYLTVGSAKANYTLDDQVNNENRNFTVYLWQEIPGYSSMGVYWGMPNDNSSAINVGFRPKYVQLHHVVGNSGTQDHHIFDTTVSTANNGVYNSAHYPTTVGATQPSGTNHLHITSTGWETIDADAEPYIAGANTSSQMFYMAFAEQPFAYANAR